MPSTRSLQNSFGPEVIQDGHDAPEVIAYEAMPQPALQFHTPILKDDQPPPPSKGHKILGVPVAIFWTSIAAILFVLGVGIGVGVGIGTRNNHDSSPSRTPTSLSETESPTNIATTTTSLTTTSASSTSVSLPLITSGTHGIASNTCNFTTPRTYYSPSGQSFTQYCFTDWPISVWADSTGPAIDLGRRTVYTFEDCIEACVKYNGNTAERKCGAVTYNSNLTSIIEVGQHSGNCLLMDKRGVNMQGSAESACAAMVA